MSLWITSLIGMSLWAQEPSVAQKVYEDYEQYREPTLDKRRFQHQDILPLIEKLKTQEQVEVNQIGTSIEGRELFLLSIGAGDSDILLWSQMHGDESTATIAIFDLFNFFLSEDYTSEKQALFREVRLHFIPMLNPDGAQGFQRRNRLGVDVNRDALRLQTPEGRALKKVRDSLEADWGFNLHDQSRYYNTRGYEKPATISFLAPAYDEQKSVNQKRGDAMKLIVEMNQLLQEHVPNQVGRYDDTFEPRAFGDNIQKWGTRTILIESGGQFDDREKQDIRKLNFLAILSGLFSIAQHNYESADIARYQEIPQNDRKLFDLKLTGLTHKIEGQEFIIDLGINASEVVVGDSLYLRGRIADIGDLSTNYGYHEEELAGLEIVPAAIYPRILKNEQELSNINFQELHQDGYAYVRMDEIPKAEDFVDYPIVVASLEARIDTEVRLGGEATFFLAQEGKIKYAVINGFLLDIRKSYQEVDFNGVLLR